jgi:PAS domain-containing protein
MSAPRPFVDATAREALDSISVPLTIAVCVRDRDARLLDFRLDFANSAAADWAGLPRDAMHGRLITDLIPGLRPAGLFDALAEVVTKGRPFHQHRQPYEGNVEEGNAFAAIFELIAVRLGDGYLSLWTELPDAAAPIDLGAVARAAVDLIPMVRLESQASPRPRLRPAT